MGLETNGAAYEEEQQNPELTLSRMESYLFEKKDQESLPRMRAFYSWLHEAIHYPEIREPVREMVDFWNTMTPIYAVNKTSRALWAVAEQTDPDFAKNRTRPEDWEVERENLRNPERRADFWQILITMEIATTKAERAKPEKLALLACGIEEPAVVSLGSSQGFDLVQLAQDKHYDSAEVGKLEKQEVTVGHDTQKTSIFIPDPSMTETVNQIIQDQPLNLSYGLGLDIFSPKDPKYARWIRACSLYLDERADSKKWADFQRLSTAHPDNVGIYYPIDLTTPLKDQHFYEGLKEKLPKAPEQYDAAISSYFTYLLRNRAERLQTIATSKELTLEVGKLFILDALRIYRNGAMHYRDNRRYMASTLYMYDKAKPRRGWQHLMTLGDGRAKQIVLHEAFGKLPMAKELGLAPTQPKSTGTKKKRAA